MYNVLLPESLINFLFPQTPPLNTLFQDVCMPRPLSSTAILPSPTGVSCAYASKMKYPQSVKLPTVSSVYTKEVKKKSLIKPGSSESIVKRPFPRQSRTLPCTHFYFMFLNMSCAPKLSVSSLTPKDLSSGRAGGGGPFFAGGAGCGAVPFVCVL
jgi:hypothetical protein